ncbi:hypothetical protein PMI14_02287 [Acidovorax sp. CF316]|uniref:hypothetical protein n=1 Tax=Acidovorax sp. CF316 TaxID=1144317 RepID=UPI00026BCF46|nr:hypothetical protein [Acidovorax sp. CF316]EJE53028.1 hypothetical protein PMI14_02287 [Acidovorax sp. CF316]
MPLNYLDFDYSEDYEGTGTFDAMAAASPAQLPAVQAEVAQVLAWAHVQFPGTQGPADEGGEWDYDLSAVQEVATPLALAFDSASGTIAVHAGTPAPARTTVTLSISGGSAFCGALREAFGVD